MKNEWPHLLADLRAKRDALTEVIAVIEKNFSIPEDDEPGPTLVPRRGRGPAKAGRRSKRAFTKRTDGRTEQKSGRRGAALARRSLPDNATGEDILAVLRKRNAPMKPGELAAATQLSVLALRRRLKDLAASGQVTLTGTTMSRRVSLGRACAAKEVP